MSKKNEVKFEENNSSSDEESNFVEKDYCDLATEFNYWNVEYTSSSLTMIFITISLMILFSVYSNILDNMEVVYSNMMDNIKYEGFCSG